MIFLALLLSEYTGVVEGSNQTSVTDKTVFSIDAIQEMREVLEELTAKRDRSADPVRTRCLDSRRERIEVLVEEAEKASEATVDAIAAGEEAKAEHEFRKVSVALVRTRQLQDEADLECALVNATEHEAAWQMGWSGVQQD